MALVVTIGNGFAEVGAGRWLMGRGQPAAFFGRAERRRRRGWLLRDRSRLDLVETTAAAKCADSSRPFLTHIPCAAPVFAVSGKVLVAPAEARVGAHSVKLVPMSLRSALCVTEFCQADEGGEEPGEGSAAWVVMATMGRTGRTALADGETMSVRPEAVVAWTGRRPTGFCPKLGLLDVVLPRGPRDLLLTFYGPGVVWFEGALGFQASAFGPSACQSSTFIRRCYGA